MAKFNVDHLHTEAMKRHTNRNNLKRRDPKNHLQREKDVNVKESYNRSLALIDEKDKLFQQKVDHLESVLSAGPVRSES